jgi:hypothetical protein
MPRNNIYIRILIDIILFYSVINGWWIVSIPLGILGTWFRESFIELIIAGVAYDALFGMNSSLGLAGWIGTITAVVLYTCILLTKRFIRK